MGLIASIVEANFSVRDGCLAVGGIPVSTIAEKFGTPLYVYDAAIIRRQIQNLKAALGEGWEVYYSVKANPAQGILRASLGEGCGLEVASAGEFEQAMAAGCRPERVLFAGPGKHPDELRYTVAHGIGEIHIESFTEIERLAAICKELGRTQKVSIRVNPTGEAQGGAMRMGGKPLQFGLDEEVLDEAIDRVLAHDCLRLNGIHLFAGTQILQVADLSAQYRKGIEIAQRVAARIGHPLGAVDFGGGLGIPYFENDPSLDLAELHQLTQELRKDIAGDPAFAGTHFMLEPGRFLVGPSGIYLFRVLDVKDSRGKRFFIVDGGMHQHLAASGNLGQTIKRNFPIAVVNKLSEPTDAAGEIVGPLCTPLDVLGRSAKVPAGTAIGDLIAVLQSGAYGRSASPMGFLSHASPAEVMVDGGEAFLIRERGTVASFLADQTGSPGPRA